MRPVSVTASTDVNGVIVLTFENTTHVTAVRLDPNLASQTIRALQEVTRAEPTAACPAGS